MTIVGWLPLGLLILECVILLLSQKFAAILIFSTHGWNIECFICCLCTNYYCVDLH